MDLDHPRKKPRLEGNEPTLPSNFIPAIDPPQSHDNKSIASANPESDEAAKEVEVGITRFLNHEAASFTGILKRRYTDFLVNEILPDGSVLHLVSLRPVNLPETPTDTAQTSGSSSKKNASDSTEVEASRSDKYEPSVSGPISDQDVQILVSHFGDDLASRIRDLYASILAHPERRPSHHPTVNSSTPVSDRTVRTRMHQDIRKVFDSRIESSTTSEGYIVFTAANRTKAGKGEKQNSLHSRRGRAGWDELGGEHLHFTIYKENKDTMEVISYLAKELKVNPKVLSFAGTKDRRGVTVQRSSAFRAEAGRVASLNRTLRNSLVGDFQYSRESLELGDLRGNEFQITLRECTWLRPEIQTLYISKRLEAAKESLEGSMRSLQTNGFFNYFGLQRFGTFASRTDNVGLKILQGDFKGAVDLILAYSPAVLAAAQAEQNDNTATNSRITHKISNEDKMRAISIDKFLNTGKFQPALDKLPRKFSAESNVIRHLGKGPKTRYDYLGAIMNIPRNLRIMYAHAYQSLVWNHAVGRRWELYGPEIVEGDLVMVGEHEERKNGAADALGTEEPEVDADGEPIIRPQAYDSAPSMDDVFLRARPLIAPEATSGAYTIFDIVLPLPGFDVVYPPNAMTQFYKDFMGDESRGGGLDPMAMRRKQRDFNLSGGYRKILGRIEAGWTAEVQTEKKGENRQFVKTDRERLVEGGEIWARKQEYEGKTEDQTPANETAEVDRKNNGVASMREERNTNLADQSGEEDSIAAIVKFKLGSSQYATVALRELTRGGVKSYKPDYGGGR